MKYIQFLICTIIFGINMFAQITDIKNWELIPFAPSRPYTFYLKNEVIEWDKKKFSADTERKKFFSDGKEYRRLQPNELKQLDAMQRIEKKSKELFFDNIRIKTKRFFVPKIEVAYYWNGGVIVGSEYSGYLGFIDLKTNSCKPSKFCGLEFSGPGELGFLTPLTINTSNDNFEFDVKIPERVALNENLNLIVSLTNNSDKPISVPEYFFSGLSIYFAFGIYDESENIVPSRNVIKYSNHKVTRSDSGRARDAAYSRAINNKFVILAPSDTREEQDSLYAEDFFLIPGRYKMVFYWDVPLNENDINNVSRFTCEKWIDVILPPPYHIKESNNDLIFDIITPKKIHDSSRPTKERGWFDCSILLTNVSDKTILVPKSLYEGLELLIYQGSICPDYKDLGIKIKRGSQYIDPNSRHKISSQYKRFAIPPTPGVRYVPLLPSETRETKFSLNIYKRQYKNEGKARLKFFWNGLLNPDDYFEVSRFVCEKWIEIDYE